MTNEEILLERANNNVTEAMIELGLNELAMNNYNNSLNWFKKAYDNNDSKAILGLAITSYQLECNSKYFWINLAIKLFGENYCETKRYKLWISTLFKKKDKYIEIGIEYKINSKDYCNNVSVKYNDLIDNKYIYDEEIEKELNSICLYSDTDKVISEIEEIYNKTNYPGVLYFLGEIYYFGYCNLPINEEKGIEYFEKAAHDGYSKAQSTLSNIYLGKASRYIYKAYNYCDEDYEFEKMIAGNCLIADYLIGTSAIHYNHHEQYFEGLTKLTEASQKGDDEATFILNVLGKENLTKRMYKKGLKKERSNFSSYLDSYYEIDFDEYEDIDFDDLDEKYIFDEE